MPPVGGGAADIVDRPGGRSDQLAKACHRGLAHPGPAIPRALLVEHALEEAFGFGGAQRRRPGRTDASSDAPARRVERQGEGAHGDDHRVPRANLAELLRSGRRLDQEGGDELVLAHRGLLRPGEELADRHPSRACGRGKLDLRISSKQRRVRVARRRCGAEVASDRAAIADLGRTDGARCHRQAGQPIAQLVDELGVGHPRAYAEPSVVAPPLPELANPREVDDRFRTPVVEVEPDHHVSAAGDRRRLRMSSLHRERLRPCGRLHELHHQARPGSGASSRVTVPSIKPYGRSDA